jgi:hypothetical protein
VERPLVSSQFAWNAACGYKACDHCLRSLETAEQMCRRLSGKVSFELPHPECCEVRPFEHVTCLNCAVSTQYMLLCELLSFQTLAKHLSYVNVVIGVRSLMSQM